MINKCVSDDGDDDYYNNSNNNNTIKSSRACQCGAGSNVSLTLSISRIRGWFDEYYCPHCVSILNSASVVNIGSLIRIQATSPRSFLKIHFKLPLIWFTPSVARYHERLGGNHSPLLKTRRSKLNWTASSRNYGDRGSFCNSRHQLHIETAGSRKHRCILQLW